LSLQTHKVTVHIDGKPIEADPGRSLLRTCLSLGFDIPYFCWHPALESVGACRQCAVKLFRDEADTRGKIVMSCMTAVTDNMRISIDDPEVRKFRAANIEWLMLNHPHDCPVCDEGGECHLQDMTVMTGHVYRRTRFRKRTYRNQYLGPFINHEMNRCIQCYRCVRFYRDYAGWRDFNVFGSRDHVYFGRREEGVLESPFSGNLVEVCPTGVFTDKTFKKNYTRPWDIASAPSVCVHCGLGCNTLPGERYGQLRRVRTRYNGEVNGYFLCDRGRFGYEFVNSPRRLREPLIRDSVTAELAPASIEQALQRLREIVSGSEGIVGIGSPRASLEANFALRTLAGPDFFFAGIPEKEASLIALVAGILTRGPVAAASLAGIASSDAVLVLGEDLANTAPMAALEVLKSSRNASAAIAGEQHIPAWDDRAVRVAAQDRHGPLNVVASMETWLDRFATGAVRRAPDDIARLAFAVAHHIDPALPEVPGFGEDDLAKEIADKLKEAEHPLIISGVSPGNEQLIKGAANTAWALARTGKDARVSFVLPECNSLGLGLMSSRGIEAALDAVEEGRADTMIILENDLFRKAPRERLVRCLEKLKHLVVIDHLFHETALGAEVVLPAATFAEASGTLVSNEGRAQRFFQVFVPEGNIRPSWLWLRDILALTEGLEGVLWQTLDDCMSALARTMPVFSPVPDVAPGADFRILGQRIPRQPARASGRTSMHAHVNIHEQKPPEDHDSPLAFSMEGYGGEPPASLIPRFHFPGWNSVQSMNKFQIEVGGPLRGGDPGVRLIEPGGLSERPDYFTDVPGKFMPGSKFLVIPLFHIFGSEELSSLSSSVEELIPEPYVALNPDDASRLGLDEGEKAELCFSEGVCFLRASLSSGLPAGCVGLPFGLPGLAGVSRDEYIDVRKAADE